MNAVHVIEGTEFERGWGHRPDGYIAFPSEDAAMLYIKHYNERYNSAPSAPDVYTDYNYIGIKACSARFEELVASKKLAFFDRFAELLK